MNTTVNGSEAEEVSRIRIAAYYVGLPSHFSSPVRLVRSYVAGLTFPVGSSKNITRPWHK